MKKIAILISLLILIISGCGDTYVNNDIYSKEYDMWEYLTPQHSYDVEYAVYENGEVTDYFYETIKVFPSGEVERESGDEITTLRAFENYIEIRESNGETIEVKRYVKIGDQNIFRSPSIRSCIADDYFRSITIKGIEFYQVLKVVCQTDSSESEIYYGYNEGIVSIYRNENGTISEIVKVDERRLQ